MNTNSIKIQLLKNLHWLLAIFFGVVWLSGDDWMKMHTFTGYGILIISIIFILKRIFNGQIFRWSQPSFKFHWIKSNLVLLLLACLVLASVSGILADSFGKDFWEDLHEVLANFSLLVIASHITLKVLSKLKKTTIINNQLRQKGHEFMNSSTFNNGYHLLLKQWQKITENWHVNSGKNLLLRGALVVLSLSYVILVISLFLVMLPVVLVFTTLIAFIVKSEQAKQHKPVTINVTPEVSH